MKRSEANLISKARGTWSAEYGCVSVLQDETTGENTEEYFSHSGCDICSKFPSGGAGTVVDIVYRSHADMEQRKFGPGEIYDGRLCGDCLCALVNGDESHLDFYVTEEDEPSITR